MRVGSRVTLQVTPYGGSAKAVTDSEVGPTGALAFDPTRLASVGGKLNRLGEIAQSSDQLNGAVARVFVQGL